MDGSSVLQSQDNKLLDAKNQALESTIAYTVDIYNKAERDKKHSEQSGQLEGEAKVEENIDNKPLIPAKPTKEHEDQKQEVNPSGKPEQKQEVQEDKSKQEGQDEQKVQEPPKEQKKMLVVNIAKA